MFYATRPKRAPAAVSSPSSAGEDAVKKFGNAKSISSDMYFGGADQVGALLYLVDLLGVGDWFRSWIKLLIIVMRRIQEMPTWVDSKAVLPSAPTCISTGLALFCWMNLFLNFDNVIIAQGHSKQRWNASQRQQLQRADPWHGRCQGVRQTGDQEDQSQLPLSSLLPVGSE